MTLHDNPLNAVENGNAFLAAVSGAIEKNAGVFRASVICRKISGSAICLSVDIK